MFSSSRQISFHAYPVDEWAVAAQSSATAILLSAARYHRRQLKTIHEELVEGFDLLHSLDCQRVRSNSSAMYDSVWMRRASHASGSEAGCWGGGRLRS